jgi:ectoine hydroxylase-related dioxygenase (phytanoyl-CoA dioxygenase family)
MEATATDSPNRSLSPEQIDDFRRSGFIAIGKLFENNEIDELRHEYDRVFAEARDSERFRNLSAKDGGGATEADEEMLQIMQMCERSLVFRRLLYHEGIVDVIEDLIGPNIQLFHDQALFKPAHHGGPIHWHQDNAYWRCLPANLVSCWLTLDDVDVANGAMHLLPGSHLAPVDHERGDVLLDAGVTDQERAVVADLPAGGMLFHHCQTLHYTPTNLTDRQRRAFAMHYMTPGTRSAHGELPVSYARPLVRSRI